MLCVFFLLSSMPLKGWLWLVNPLISKWASGLHPVFGDYVYIKPLQTFLVFFSHSFPFLFSFVTFSTEVAIHGETISKDQFLFITRTDYVILAWDRGLEGIAKPEKLEPWPLR